MDKLGLDKALENIQGIVGISVFGSYGTDMWIEGRSDIDVAVILKSGITFQDTLKMEDNIEEVLEKHFNYDNIHLTFIMFNDFSCKYARMAIDSEIQFIVDYDSWFDFQHYVLKYARNNAIFEKVLKIDEQYTYFGGIIDESIL